MLTGRYWITPDGLITIAGDEHAHVVKHLMLGIQPEEVTIMPIQRLFTPLTPEEASFFIGRGVDPEAVSFLRKGLDPRLWAISKWNWIRTAGSIFNLWRFDDLTLEMIRTANNFWRMQSKVNEYDKIEIEEAETGDLFSVPVKKLLTLGASAEALKYTSKGVGQYRNPKKLRR